MSSKSDGSFFFLFSFFLFFFLICWNVRTTSPCYELESLTSKIWCRLSINCLPVDGKEIIGKRLTLIEMRQSQCKKIITKMHRNVEWPKLPNELEVREENKRKSDCLLIGFFIIIKVTLISVFIVWHCQRPCNVLFCFVVSKIRITGNILNLLLVVGKEMICWSEMWLIKLPPGHSLCHYSVFCFFNYCLAL